jgi:hypothetical protein
MRFKIHKSGSFELSIHQPDCENNYDVTSTLTRWQRDSAGKFGFGFMVLMR